MGFPTTQLGMWHPAICHRWNGTVATLLRPVKPRGRGGGRPPICFFCKGNFLGASRQGSTNRSLVFRPSNTSNHFSVYHVQRLMSVTFDTGASDAISRWGAWGSVKKMMTLT